MTTTCPRCQTANTEDSRFCQHCGQPLRPSVADTATVLWNGVAAQGDAAERAVPVPVLFAAKDALVVGRAEDCDVRLDHPSVSRRHATLERKPDGLWLTDLGGVNGLRRGGQRVTEPVRLTPEERVGVGP